MFRPYPKIQSVFKRNPDTNYRTFLAGQWSLPAFEYLQQCGWYATEKVDGMNMRIMVDDGGESVHIGGRTDRAEIPGDLLDHMARIGEVLRTDSLWHGSTFFGEGYGPGIQKGGGNYRNDKGFILFDILDPEGHWVDRDTVEDIADEVDISVVPRVQPISGMTLWNWYHEISAQAGIDDTASPLLPDGGGEGVVLRPQTELVDGFGNRVIAKLKYKDFAPLLSVVK